MRKYSCEILLKQEGSLEALIQRCLKATGFTPRYTDVFFDQFTKGKYDVGYGEASLLKLMAKEEPPERFKLKDRLYEEGGFVNWFSFRCNNTATTLGCTWKLEWSNTSLEVLLENPLWKELLADERLIWAVCFDERDAMEQANTHFIEYDDKPLPAGVKVIKNEVGDKIIDVSKHWGRFAIARELSFIAAPLLWIGEPFFAVIDKKKWLDFKYASETELGGQKRILVQLFPPEANPADYRDRQKDFWSHFKLEKVMREYKKANEIDMIAWVQAQLEKKKAAKRKA